MSPEELKALQKAARKAKRIASEKASELHDLVEDGLPAAYRELPAMAEAAFAACEAWEKAEQKAREAEASTVA